MSRAATLLLCIGTCACGPIEPTIGWQTDSMELVAVDYPVSLFVNIFQRGNKTSPSRTHAHQAAARCEGVVCEIESATDTTGPRERTRITVRPQSAAYFDIVVDVDDLDSGESFQRSFAFESGVPEDISIEVLPGPGATRRDGDTLVLDSGQTQAEAELNIDARHGLRRIAFESHVVVNGQAQDSSRCRTGDGVHRCPLTLRPGRSQIAATVGPITKRTEVLVRE